MKNNFLRLLLYITISLLFCFNVFANDFNFNVTEIEITENGNIYNGNNGGTVTTNDGLEITSDSFKFNKLTNILEAFGNVKVVDNNKDITILAKRIFYHKNDEIVFTQGKTFVFFEDRYKIDTDDLFFYRQTMLLSSLNKTFVNDILLKDFYTLDEFNFSITDEILKGKQVQLIINKDKDLKNDKYFFKDGFFDLKNRTFLSKDINVIFDKDMYDNNKNDPRLKAVSGSGDEFNTYLKKAIFTTCEKNEKCPPWKIEASKVRHDKLKKRIIYDNAWLKVYNVPILYYPKFFHPDPTVKRQSGFLKPTTGSQQNLGNSIYIPYFYALSVDKDITVKPRIYGDGKFVLQNEYRQKTKNTSTVADFSLVAGNETKNGTKTHLFAKSYIDLQLSDFNKSEVNIQFQKTSNDTYLKLFNLESPLITDDTSSLESNIKLVLQKDDYNFTSTISQFETLSGKNSDRYQHVLPSYSLSKNFYFDGLNGNFNFISDGNNTISSTNINQTTITNNLDYTSYNKLFDNGLKSNFNLFLKNLNSVGKNSATYKSSPQSELMTSYAYNLSLPLMNNQEKVLNTLIPKMSFRVSPNEMKNHEQDDVPITIDSIFNHNRLSMADSYEGGESLTIGIDYKKEKIVETLIDGEKIKLIEDFFEMKLATVFRINDEKSIAKTSSLNERQSNYVGQMKYSFSRYFALNYNFSIKDDLNAFEYNSIDTQFTFNNFYSEFNYIEENGNRGTKNVIENKSRYTFDENNSIKFNTRRNEEINLTEYYDLVYQYRNDCLEASVQYKKRYYNDMDIKPTEELFFTITIIPLTTFSPDKIVR